MIGLLLRQTGWLIGAGLQNVGLGGFSLLPVIAALLIAVVPAGATWVTLKINHAEQIATARADAEIACNAHIAELERAINEESDRLVDEAAAAAHEVQPARTAKELREACAQEPSCIEHAQINGEKSK
jgi:hypothetical protein